MDDSRRLISPYIYYTFGKRKKTYPKNNVINMYPDALMKRENTKRFCSLALLLAAGARLRGVTTA
jgi:hypothetical protein